MAKSINLIILLLLIGQLSFAQTNKELAKTKLQQAIKLEDEDGKYDEALVLIAEAQKLDPQNITYPYEMAYTYSAKKEYQKAADILEKLTTHKDVYDQVYQALGNAYDYLDLGDKAIETYKKGLTFFPNSGRLYAELGNMQLNKKNYNDAVSFYEKGIDVDPTYSSNYYRAAKVFFNSANKIWGMIYGELFVNIDRNSDRTREISKLLLENYKSQITFSDGTKISFTKNATLSPAEQKTLSKVQSFSITAYEALLKQAIAGQKEININTLSTIRSKFIELYYKKKYNEKYPNVLFDYQREIERLGHGDAYNHWLLLAGDEDGFNEWRDANKTKWDNFIKWFVPNAIKLDKDHKFLKNQY